MFKTKEEVIDFLTKAVQHVHKTSRFFLTGGPIVVKETGACGKCGQKHAEGLECPQFMGSVPYNTNDVQICPTCGGMAIRKGTCHTCIHCGASLGCS